MKQYFISGVWTTNINGQKIISYVMLHDSDNDKSFKIGRKINQDNVIKIMKTENVLVYTIEWNYTFREWQKGAEVSFDKINETEYLVTKKDGKLINNLIALLPMKVLTTKTKNPLTLGV